EHEKEFEARIAAAKKVVEEAKKAEAAAKDAEKEKAKKEREAAEKALESIQKEADAWKKLEIQPKTWELERIYATDGFRLLANREFCLSCHQVGNHGVANGPRLDPVYERLRPEWTLMWIGNPNRILIYPRGNAPMPQNFPNGDVKLQEVF